MLNELAERRDAGKPFDLLLASGKTVLVTPLKVCRGYARLAPVSSPQAQDYHWLLSVHPLEVARVDLTEDEALWAVLWMQGVSEEGATRYDLCPSPTPPPVAPACTGHALVRRPDLVAGHGPVLVGRGPDAWQPSGANGSPGIATGAA